MPDIPQHVLMSVKSVSLSKPKARDVGLRECYESLTKARNLQSLSIDNCTLERTNLLNRVNRFACRTKLLITISRGSIWDIVEQSVWLTEALKKDRFPCLQELELNICEMSVFYASSHLAQFEPAFAVLGSTLQKLNISTEVEVTDEDVSVLEQLQSSSASEIHLALYDGHQNEDPFSIQLFAGLRSLTSIEFGNYWLEDVCELALLPNLKEVSFTRCYFDEEEALGLMETCGSIEKITFFKCQATPDDTLWDGPVTPS